MPPRRWKRRLNDWSSRTLFRFNWSENRGQTITTLLIAVSRLDEYREDRSAPPPFAHDRQVTTFEFTVDGRRTRLTLDSDTPPDILRFMKQVATAYGIEL